jgi:hypothetical protein
MHVQILYTDTLDAITDLPKSNIDMDGYSELVLTFTYIVEPLVSTHILCIDPYTERYATICSTKSQCALARRLDVITDLPKSDIDMVGYSELVLTNTHRLCVPFYVLCSS